MIVEQVCMGPPSHAYCLSCTEGGEQTIQGACKVEWQMANKLLNLPSSEHVSCCDPLLRMRYSPLHGYYQKRRRCLLKLPVTNLRDRRFSPRVREYLT